MNTYRCSRCGNLLVSADSICELCDGPVNPMQPNLKTFANAPFTEIDRLQAEIKHIYLQLERSQACEARLKRVVQNFVDYSGPEERRLYNQYNAMRDALDFCSNYDTNHKKKD